MTDRIKELIKASGGILHNDDKLTPMLVGSGLSKFAELIVKETMQVVANNLPQNTYLDVAEAVIDHFGIEE